MDAIFYEFAVCMKSGDESNSDSAKSLVKKLQNHISENYYLCTNEILSGLGHMHIADECFKHNIDKHSDGTAEFVCKSIKAYCSNLK